MPTRLKNISKRNSKMTDLAGVQDYIGPSSLMNPDYAAYLAQGVLPDALAQPIGDWRANRRTQADAAAQTVPYDAYQNPTGPATDPQLDWERLYQPQGNRPAYIAPGPGTAGLNIGLVTKPRADAVKDKKRPR